MSVVPDGIVSSNLLPKTWAKFNAFVDEAFYLSEKFLFSPVRMLILQHLTPKRSCKKEHKLLLQVNDQNSMIYSPLMSRLHFLGSLNNKKDSKSEERKLRESDGEIIEIWKKDTLRDRDKGEKGVTEEDEIIEMWRSPRNRNVEEDVAKEFREEEVEISPGSPGKEPHHVYEHRSRFYHHHHYRETTKFEDSTSSKHQKHKSDRGTSRNRSEKTRSRSTDSAEKNMQIISNPIRESRCGSGKFALAITIVKTEDKQTPHITPTMSDSCVMNIKQAEDKISLHPTTYWMRLEKLQLWPYRHEPVSNSESINFNFLAPCDAPPRSPFDQTSIERTQHLSKRIHLFSLHEEARSRSSKMALF